MALPAMSWTNALSAAHRALLSGQKQFREAVLSIAEGMQDLRQGDSAAPQRIMEDVVELGNSVRTIKAGAAVVRADYEVGNEILNMVRHDDSARTARDTRPRPGSRARPRIDLYA
jgi:hypothetical protein